MPPMLPPVSGSRSSRHGSSLCGSVKSGTKPSSSYSLARCANWLAQTLLIRFTSHSNEHSGCPHAQVYFWLGAVMFTGLVKFSSLETVDEEGTETSRVWVVSLATALVRPSSIMTYLFARFLSLAHNEWYQLTPVSRSLSQQTAIGCAYTGNHEIAGSLTNRLVKNE